MQIFDLENEWVLATAIEAHLCEGGQDAGFARLRAKCCEGVCLLFKTQEMQKHRRPRLWRHVYFLETAVYLRSDVLRTIGICDATVVPHQVENRQVWHRTGVGETASGTICQAFSSQTTVELVDEP